MTAEIFNIGCITRLDMPVDKILEQAKDKLQGCVIVGFDHDGNIYAASSYADGGSVLWLLEACKQKMFDAVGELP